MTVYYTHSLDEMTSHKKEKETTKGILPRMEIEFSEYVFPTQIDSRWFSNSIFITKNKTGGYVPTEKYTSYQIIDNINVGKPRHK